MTDLEIVKAIHLVAAAVWTGGLLVLAFSVTAIRSVTDDKEVLRSVDSLPERQRDQVRERFQRIAEERAKMRTSQQGR